GVERAGDGCGGIVAGGIDERILRKVGLIPGELLVEDRDVADALCEADGGAHGSDTGNTGRGKEPGAVDAATAADHAPGKGGLHGEGIAELVLGDGRELNGRIGGNIG